VKTLLCCVVLGAACAAVLPLEAQRRPARARAAPVAYQPRLGAHLGYSFDAEAVLLGAQAMFPIAPRVDLYPSFDVYFVDVGSLWALNFDARYRPRTRMGVFYFGGGLNYMRQSALGLSGSDTQLNILGGFESRRAGAAPFGEARLTFGDASNFQIVGGVSFRLR
jgi:hypothetical protein